MVTVNPVKCRICGYEWEPRKAVPKQCPRCKRYDWSAPIQRESEEPKAKRYVVIGGPVVSQHDGQLHYIGPEKLCRLYGVSRGECIMARDIGDPQLAGVRLEDWIVLRPDPDGQYQVPNLS